MRIHPLASLALLWSCQDVAGFSSSSRTSTTTGLATSLARSHGKKSLVTSFASVEKEAKTVVESKDPAAKFLEDVGPQLLGKSIPYAELTIGVLKETYPGENRVSQTPDSIASLVKEGLTVVVEAGGKSLFIFSYSWRFCGLVFGG